MKKMVYFVLGGYLAFLTGCATTTAGPGSGGTASGSGDDGIIKQRVDFRDLPLQEQDVILHGGGGE